MNFLLRALLFGLIGSLLLSADKAAATTKTPFPQQIAALDFRGQAQYHWLWMDLYDAELWSAKPISQRHEIFAMRHALRLTYDRDFDRALLIDASLDLLAKQAPLTPEQQRAWRTDLELIFPSVRAGESIAALYDPKGLIHFYLNDQPKGSIHDPLFARRFMAIWLGADSKFPEKGARLMGLSDPDAPLPFMTTSEQ